MHHQTRRTRRSPVVPNQHGAWAFLALPVALAATVSGWHPALVPLVVAWVAAYPLAWGLTGVLAAPRPERFRRAVAVWAPVAVPAAAVTVAWRPWLVWVGLLYLVGFAVSLRYARARDERALGNDLVLVAQCAAMVPVVVGVAAAGGWAPPFEALDHRTWLLAGVCAAALVGSTLHVKSLIRERRDPRYARASRAFAVVCVPASGVAAAAWGTPSGWFLVVPFAALAVRSFLVDDPTWRPARVGLVELALLVVLATCAALA